MSEANYIELIEAMDKISDKLRADPAVKDFTVSVDWQTFEDPGLDRVVGIKPKIKISVEKVGNNK